jgi:acyl dehydratase
MSDSRILLAQADDAVLWFEDVQTGDSFASPGRTVTEADVVAFAGLSGDFHSLHMDATYAAATLHGQRIAHGMLIVAISAGLVAKLPFMRFIERSTLGLSALACRFLKPVFIGDTVHVRLEVAQKLPGRKPDRGTLILRRTITNQHGVAVVEGDWNIVVRTRPAGV